MATKKALFARTCTFLYLVEVSNARVLAAQKTKRFLCMLAELRGWDRQDRPMKRN